MVIDETVLGDKALSEELLRVIEAVLARNESISGILPTLSGNAVAATDKRLLFATEEQVDLELDYEAVTAIEIRTGWWSRGITFATEEGEIECDVEDKDVVTAFGNIVRQHAPHIDVPEGGGGSGGLISRARGVFDTATGQDIRKFEEFVETSTTVLVGLHRDQAAMAEKQTQLEDGIENVRQAQEAIDARLARLDEATRELCERVDASNRMKAQEAGSGVSSINRLVLFTSLAAIILAIASIVLRFV